MSLLQRLSKLDGFFFSLENFLLSDFPVFGKKQICMDGEQMGELALIIRNPFMEMNKGKSRFLI